MCSVYSIHCIVRILVTHGRPLCVTADGRIALDLRLVAAFVLFGQISYLVVFKFNFAVHIFFIFCLDRFHILYFSNSIFPIIFCVLHFVFWCRWQDSIT